MRNARKTAADFGLSKPKTFLELWEGDINIAAEIEELSLLNQLPEHWYFSGPLFAHLDTEIPREIISILEKDNKKKIYFAMGSSANRSLLLKVLSAFKGMDLIVVAPIKSHLKSTDEVPQNVYVTDWLPAPEVMQMVDIAVIHGGQGTVQTTVSAGVPFVGVGMQPEQELNIYLYKEFGNAIQISKKKLNTKRIQDSINELLTNAKYKEKALEAKSILENIDVTKRILEIVNLYEQNKD